MDEMPSTITKKELFGTLDIKSIIDNPDFKEDSVRETIVHPILKALGYQEADIVRSKNLQHPFIRIGSKDRPITLVPDYCLKVEGNYAWVLDAKAPNEEVTDPGHLEQVYSYTANREIRGIYFAICNGIKFILFRREQPEPILYFSIDEIENYWEKMKLILSPDSFQVGKNFTYETTTATAKPTGFDYKNRPLLEEIPVKKQTVKRHFGVHGYFTKQSWNVVAEYIKNFTKPGDLVLDPFGGSGITAIEAIANSRSAISIDINPMAVFIVKALIAPVNNQELLDAFNRVIEAYEEKEPKSKAQIKDALKKYSYPKNIQLPKGSDVNSIEKLFDEGQLAKLALLKSLIKKEKNENVRETLMLMFSGLLNKINLTYHASTQRSEGGGDSSIFRYYRYRIAKKPAFIDVLYYFKTRFKKVSAAKKELSYFINEKTKNNINI